MNSVVYWGPDNDRYGTIEDFSLPSLSYFPISIFPIYIFIAPYYHFTIITIPFRSNLVSLCHISHLASRITPCTATKKVNIISVPLVVCIIYVSYECNVECRECILFLSICKSGSQMDMMSMLKSKEKKKKKIKNIFISIHT